MYLESFVAVMLALLFAMPLTAQDTTSRLTGRITDGLGATVPGATVILTNQLTKAEVARQTTTADGSYAFLELRSGTYTVTVQATGFNTSVTAGILLDISSSPEIAIKLSPGQSTASVTVYADANPQVENGTSTLSTVITPGEVTDLPIPNRDITQLILLTPGVAMGGDLTSLNTASMSINGGRTLNEEFLLDGSSVINGATGNVNRIPDPDALSDFRVIAANASAEYGRTGGAVISVGTRSGTDTYHGTAYELLRNNRFDANTFFNKLQTPMASRPKDDYNQFGFAVGGPIRIPWLYDGRKRSFFYVNYDNTVARTSGTATLTQPVAPPVSAAGYNFTGLSTITDPLTNAPFPNDTIPLNRVDPAALQTLSLFPPATSTSLNYHNYFTQQDLASIDPIYFGRMDQNIGENIRVFASVEKQDDPTQNVVDWNNYLNPTYPTSIDRGWDVALGYTQVLSSTLVLNLGAGFSQDSSAKPQSSAGINPTQVFGTGTAPAMYAPEINISGYTSFGPAANSIGDTVSNQYSYFGSLTKILGPHTFKVGGLFRKNQLNSYNPAVVPGGVFNFTGEITAASHSTSPGNYYALADFLLGKVKTASYGLPQAPDGRRNFNVGAYFQDDWRAAPKLLLNLGIRYEYESPLTISNNQYSRVDPGTGTLLIANVNASNNLNLPTPKANFAPRVGLIYSFTPDTIFRSGFGMYYAGIFSNLGGQIGYPGYETNVNFGTVGTGLPQAFSYSQGIPLIGVSGASNPAAAVSAATVANPYTFASTEFGGVSPSSLTYQWSANIQQVILHDTTLQIGYVGTHGVHNPIELPVNLPNPALATQVAYANTTIATQQARPYQTLGQWNIAANYGSSVYHSLQVGVRRQVSRGPSVGLSYTWSHSIDDSSGIYNYSQPNGLDEGQYPSDPTIRRTQERSNSAFDLRSFFNANIRYTTKGPWYTRGFLISGTAIARSGVPLTVIQAAEFPGITNAVPVYQRPNGTTKGLRLQKGFVSGTAYQWLQSPYTTNPSYTGNFPLTPSGPIFSTIGGVRTQVVPTELGNLGRYSIDAPGAWIINMALGRTFKLEGPFSLQLRADGFNILNHTNFNAPNVNLATITTPTTLTGPPANFSNNSGFGQITGAQRSRYLQLVTRITF